MRVASCAVFVRTALLRLREGFLHPDTDRMRAPLTRTYWMRVPLIQTPVGSRRPPGKAIGPAVPVLARVAAAVVGLGLLVGCAGGGSGEGAGDANARFVSGSGTVTTIPRGERKPAPALVGETLTGRRISLADFEGKVVVLNVWGSWCAPCRKEAPDLVAAAKALKPSGVEFLGVNTRDNDPGPARAFVRTFKIPYPSVYDPNGEQLLGFRETLPPSAIPSTLVIDRQGLVAARVLGTLSQRTLEQLATDVEDSR
jgi:thiol-disulfide isomerase/thioredoxin